MSKSDAAALNDKAFDQIDRGDKKGAFCLFQEVCELEPTNSEARMMIGVIQAEGGELSSAGKNLRLALELDPEYADAFYYLASVLQALGQTVEALTCAKRAVELDPEFSDARNLLAVLEQSSLEVGHHQAKKHKQDTLSVISQQNINQANVLLQQGKLDDAVKCYETVIQQQPNLAIIWFMLGRTRGQQTQYTEAERCCREAIRLDSELVEAHLLLASFLLMQGKTSEACKHSDMALQLAPTDINAISLAANIAKHMGQPEKSYELLAPLLKKGVMHINISLAFAMIASDLDKEKQAIDLIENIIRSDHTLSVPGKSNLHFNLGILYDSIKHYDQAYFHYDQGNKLKSMRFDRKQHEQMIDRQIAAYSPELLSGLPRSSLSSQRPIFIVGMVRSGTSLVEQILSSHPGIFGGGELADIYQYSNALPGIVGSDISYPECISQLSQQHVDSLSQRYLDRLKQISPDASRVTDKLPGNFMYLGLIELLFPDAHVIHCTRDPADTCLSAYFQDFSSNHPYAYDLENLGAYYQGYLKLMSHWRKVLNIPLLEVNYEDLIDNQEQVSRSLVEFCGLDWDERCLQFHENDRFVRTASYDQVNRPLYKQSVARWKNYEKHIEPLLTALNK
ncbi:MAG: sulfotransferase [Methylococcales bacterium]